MAIGQAVTCNTRIAQLGLRHTVTLVVVFRCEATCTPLSYQGYPESGSTGTGTNGDLYKRHLGQMCRHRERRALVASVPIHMGCALSTPRGGLVSTKALKVVILVELRLVSTHMCCACHRERVFTSHANATRRRFHANWTHDSPSKCMFTLLMGLYRVFGGIVFRLWSEDPTSPTKQALRGFGLTHDVGSKKTWIAGKIEHLVNKLTAQGPL